MAIATCPRCKKMFDKQALPICAKCEPKEQKDYELIRETLEKMPNLNAEEIAIEVNLGHEVVLRMMDQGLIQSVSVNQTIKCGRCGNPAISVSKRLCQTCLEKLNTEVAMQQSKVKMAPKKNAQVGECIANVRKTLSNKRK